MVIDGICFPLDIFVNKANDIENLTKASGVNPTIALVYVYCANKLQNIARSSIN